MELQVATTIGQPAPRHGVEPGTWLDELCRGTELGALLVDHDWAATSLGDPGAWPAGLRAALGICMQSRFPMLVAWGPELVALYNDAYRPMLGEDKHPDALGTPVPDVWAEVWDVLGPQYEQVVRTGEASWSEDLRLVVHRNGFAEECYFSYSLSPLLDDGAVAGVLCVSYETTDRVVSGRRLGCLADLTAALVTARHVTDVCRFAAAALVRWQPSIMAADLYLQVGDALTRVASNRKAASVALVPNVLERVLAGGEAVVIGTDDVRLPAERFVVPLGGRDGVVGVLNLDLNPQRSFDDTYRAFAVLVGQVISAALDTAYRRSVELGEHRHISDTLQAAMLQPASDLPTVAARYVPAQGNLAVGGDWYDVIDLGDHRRAIVVGDCVGHGLEAATNMAHLRSASRAMLIDGQDPAATLASLDSFSATVDGARYATAVCAVIDRRANTITYARAGHPPPLVVTGGTLTWLDGAVGVPLGVDPDEVRVADTVHLSPDSTLVFYTDGLIERPGEAIDVGMERLGAEVVRLGEVPSVHQLADALLEHLLQDDNRDDVVLVVKRLSASELS
jgi:hypothetical protein